MKLNYVGEKVYIDFGDFDVELTNDIDLSLLENELILENE